MKKRIFIILFLAIGFAGCKKSENPQPIAEEEPTYEYMISIDQAQLNLMELLGAMNITKYENLRIAERFTYGEPVLTKTADGSRRPYIHVFNFENNSGSAIMSGDVRVPSLIALIEDGSLPENLETGNPEFEMIMGRLRYYYADQINNYTIGYSGTKSSSYSIHYGKWQFVDFEMITGSCKVKWDQTNPYNMYCPLKNGKRTYAGCVPVAVAQLMSMYEYPEKYGSYSFDWESILDSEEPDCISDEQQVARLIRELGTQRNLDVDYGLYEDGGSSAYSNNIPRTLRNFGYTSGGTYQTYSSSKIISELEKGYPCLIDGTNSKNSGHQFLAHGLREMIRTLEVSDESGTIVSFSSNKWYFLKINMGWNGSYDGYYIEGIFDANSFPYNDNFHSNLNTKTPISDVDYYKDDLDMVIGIRK